MQPTRENVRTYLLDLQARITGAIEQVEAQSGGQARFLSDAWRKPERFALLCRVALLDEPDRTRTLARLARVQRAAAAVDAGAIARTVQGGDVIREAVAEARRTAIAVALNETPRRD